MLSGWLILISVTLAIVLYIRLQVWPYIREYAVSLRTLAAELGKARKEVEDANDTLRRRGEEVQTLNKELTELRARTARLLDRAQKAEDDLKTAREEAARVQERLTASEARRDELQNAAEDASMVRWELASRFSNNEEARAAALNNLRRPAENVSTLSSVTHVPKSPSESFLLSMRPDLSVYDSDDLSDEEDGVGTTHPMQRVSRSIHAFPYSRSPPSRTPVGVPSVSQARSSHAHPRSRPTSSESDEIARAKRLEGLSTSATVPDQSSREEASGPVKPARPGSPESNSGVAPTQRQPNAGANQPASLPSRAPQSVSLLRAPWTASSEASQAARGLAMTDLDRSTSPARAPCAPP